MFDYSNYFKNFQNNFQTPSFDVSSAIAQHRKNLEALTAANQAFTQGAQKIATKSAEFLRDHVEQSLNASRDLLTNQTPDTNNAKRSQYSRDAVTNSVNQLREIFELATKTQFEAFDILNRRMTQSLQENSKTAGTSGRKAA